MENRDIIIIPEWAGYPAIWSHSLLNFWYLAKELLFSSLVSTYRKQLNENWNYVPFEEFFSLEFICVFFFINNAFNS